MRVESRRAHEKVVGGIAVAEGVDIDDDEPLDAVGDERVAEDG